MTLPWYPRDMGKYARDTKSLSLMEHGAYNLLLDHYYSTGPLRAFEQCSSNASLMPDHSRLYRVCSAMTKPEQDAVDNVLKIFFTLDEKGFFRHRKADEVIEQQTKKHENRVRAGKQAKLKQCPSNTPQTQTKKKTKTPPLPPKGGQEPFSKDSGEKEKRFTIEVYLTDAGRADAKAAAPGWDIHHLIREFDERVNGGSFERPKKPIQAFVAWCAAFTKGRLP